MFLLFEFCSGCCSWLLVLCSMGRSVSGDGALVEFVLDLVCSERCCKEDVCSAISVLRAVDSGAFVGVMDDWEVAGCIRKVLSSLYHRLKKLLRRNFDKILATMPVTHEMLSMAGKLQ